jgi:hypothetical protein
MRTIALIRKSLVLMASLAALTALGGSDNTSATGTTIAPTPSPIWVIQGSWYNSGVTLSGWVNPAREDLLISEKNSLLVGMLIRVDTEYMLIEELISGGTHHEPDTMMVSRAQNGSTATAHASGAGIFTQAVNVNIYANDVTDPLGLGSFEIHMVLPPEVQYVQMVPQEGWLTSTGRTSWGCDGPYFMWDTTWVASCTTLYDTPAGPTGSGLIATLTLLPLQSVVKVSTISFSGSTLVNSHAQPIPATTRNLSIRVMACPDATLDGMVNSNDYGQIAKNFGDQGVDSGAVLADGINDHQTNGIAISDQSALIVGDTISIEKEQMTVSALHEGSPDTMSVVRAVNLSRATSHNTGTGIFRATWDGNYDGRKGYTDPRDVTDEGSINSLDAATIARVFGTTCPAP